MTPAVSFPLISCLHVFKLCFMNTNFPTQELLTRTDNKKIIYYNYQGRSLEKKADGKPKETKYITPYNGSIPVTTSKQYGHRLGTPQSCKMSQLERLTCYHKKKSGIADNYT